MKRFVFCVGSVALLFVVGCTDSHPESLKPNRAEALAAIKKLGGKVTEEGTPPRMSISFFGTQVTDAGLEHLKGLTDLESLDLRLTKVTDAGLEHLKGLTSLTSLNLDLVTQITDAGLEHLKGLTNLTSLNLGRTKVTDAGLEHLKGLKNFPH